MVPPPALAFQRVDPMADAVRLLLQALETAQGDRIVLQAEQVPMLVTGSQKCELMSGPVTQAALQQLATHLFPPDYLDALEDVGGTRWRWSGYEALAEYGDRGLTIDIKRVPGSTGAGSAEMDALKRAGWQPVKAHQRSIPDRRSSPPRRKSA